MTVNHLSKIPSSHSSLFEKKNKTINIHQTYSNLLDVCNVCIHTRTHTLAASYTLVLTLTAWLPQRAEVSLAACPATGVLIGCRAGCHHASWGKTFVCVCVTVAANKQSKCSPLSRSASLYDCLFCFWNVLILILCFWIFFHVIITNRW